MNTSQLQTTCFSLLKPITAGTTIESHEMMCVPEIKTIETRFVIEISSVLMDLKLIFTTHPVDSDGRNRQLTIRHVG